MNVTRSLRQPLRGSLPEEGITLASVLAPGLRDLRPTTPRQKLAHHYQVKGPLGSASSAIPSKYVEVFAIVPAACAPRRAHVQPRSSGHYGKNIASVYLRAPTVGDRPRRQHLGVLRRAGCPAVATGGVCFARAGGDHLCYPDGPVAYRWTVKV
jgi:hypothetical protein